MLDFIAKYWLEFIFGIVALGLTALARYFYTLYKKEKQRLEDEAHEKIIKELKEAINTEHEHTAELLIEEHNNTKQLFKEERLLSKDDDDQIRHTVESLDSKLDVVSDGVLSIQGKQFKDDCRALLKPDHEITLDEFEEIESDHNTYNKMGGNHTGDKLFAMVEAKFKNSLSNHNK